MKSSRCWPREDWDLVIMTGSNGASDQAQESDLNHKMRAQPLILVLLFLAAVCLSTILSKATAWLTMWQLGPFSYVEWLSQLLSFPFSIVCVVWIGARSGRTGWSTWTVPLLLWVAAMLIGMIGSVLVNLGSLSYQITSHLMPGVLISIVWTQTLRPDVFTYVCLAFLFRASCLHLRPAEAESSPHRLTVLSILGLTTLVAISLGIDALANRQAFGQTLPWNTPYLSRYYFLMTTLYSLSTALMWLSTAWLFVANNRMRWIGVVGLVVYIAYLSVYFFAFLPEFIRQTRQSSSLPSITFSDFDSSFMVFSQFAISVFQIGFVFLYLGMIHLAGYRWDILRRAPSVLEKTEVSVDGIPPVLSPVPSGPSDWQAATAQLRSGSYDAK